MFVWPTLTILLLLALPCLVRPQDNVADQTFWPSAVPLAVRSPYFSCWMLTTTGRGLLEQWPRFWNYASPGGNDPFLTWQGLVTVDGKTYQWLGDWNTGSTPAPVAVANLTRFTVTPTRTIFEIQAGPMGINITFLSPIEPSDWVSQSIPYSYVYMDATSIDGQSHHVIVYADVSAEWVSGNRGDNVTWNTTVTSSAIYHAVKAASPTLLGENFGQANDGILYHGMLSGPDVTYQSGFGQDLRAQFQTHGVLANTQDSDFRNITTNQPAFALSADLGSISSTSTPVVWILAYVRDPTIEYVTSDGTSQQRSPYYVTQYTSSADAVLDALINFTETSQRAQSLDNSIIQNATKISPQYADLVSLAARQVFGAIDITVSAGSDGQWNSSDVQIFMKDIGNTQRVNPVEVLYQAFPMFLYLNSSLGKPLLEPLLQYESSSQFSLAYAAADLGTKYPQALGNNSDHPQGLEQTGNMLIMTYAQARTSGDGSLISRYYDLLRGWTEYVSNNTLQPTASQQSADQQSIAGSSNLAVKGIIAIQAMAEMSRALGESDDAELFGQRAKAFMTNWESLAFSSDQSHLLMDYGDESSWALMYNLYPDRLLGTNLVNSSIYQQQSTFYGNLPAGAFGLGIDSEQDAVGNSAWMLFYGAAAAEADGLQSLISMAWSHASSNQSQGVFPTTYDLSTGNLTGGSASPAQGAMFAPLALSVSNKTITIPSSSTSGISSSSPSASGHSSKSANIGAIVGGVIGGLSVIGCVVGALFIMRSRSRKRDAARKTSYDGLAEPEPFYDSAPAALPSASDIPRDAPLHTTSPVITPLAEDLRVISPSKMREYMLSRNMMTGPTPGASTGSGETAQPLSSVHPPSTDSAASHGAIASLQTELESLRRVVHDLQADRMEPPPGYTG